MPQLIRNLEAKVFDNVTGHVKYVKNVSAEIQTEDYIGLFGFSAYLQNLTRVEDTEPLTTSIFFGLKNNLALPVTIINIDY